MITRAHAEDIAEAMHVIEALDRNGHPASRDEAITWALHAGVPAWEIVRVVRSMTTADIEALA